ncbi:MAG: HAMP domain-containing histidine kinase [Proteobacteria bacterium]|nr:HAMP domain-containing histidine kinase [Pseudomonadota bacterium]
MTVVAGSGQAPGRAVYDIAPHIGTRSPVQVRVNGLVADDRAKDELLAILGHELRTPLGAIANALAVLRSEQKQTAAQRRAQALIDRQVRRMMGLVDDLFDASRIRHGCLRLRRERMDLRAVVSHAVETLESETNGRRQQLDIALPEEPVWLRADFERLEQVFVNLLANASRYTDEGGKIAIFMHLRDGHAVVRVRDTGIGIAPEALPLIFDLYRQADAASPRSRPGLGIGLALVRQLVQLHGGSVSAASAGLGRGSEFTLRLPLEDPAAVDRSPF